MEKNNTKLRDNTKLKKNNSKLEKNNTELKKNNTKLKTEILFRTFEPRQLLVTWGFPTLYFGLLSDLTQACQAFNSLR